jgi:hypothetical protein
MYNVFDYKTLCDVVIRHSYFLNDGETDFDTMPLKTQQDMLSKYQFTDVLQFVTSARTAETMRNHQMVMKTSNEGIRLMIRTKGEDLKPLTGLANDTVFVFGLKLGDPLFSYFTQAVSMPGEVLFFPNAQADELPLSIVSLVPLITDAQRVNSNYLLVPEDTATMLDAWFPGESRVGLIGLIYIKVAAGATAYNLLSSGDTKANFPQFKIHFNTQSTFWKYKRESVGFEAETSAPLPLTKHGFIHINPNTAFTTTPPSEALNYSYPNPLLETFEATPTKLYSVIFI